VQVNPTTISREVQLDTNIKRTQVAGQASLATHDAERRRTPSVLRPHPHTDPATLPAHVGGLSNEQLAHELLLNREFRLNETANIPDEQLVHTRIKEPFERVFWTSLAEDLSAVPPCYARTLSVLEEIKKGVQSLSTGHPESQRIADILDLELIAQQIEKETLDCKNCEDIAGAVVEVILVIHDRARTTESRKVNPKA
jgi:hypothetical protein